MKRKDEKLIELIKKTKLDGPSADFTGNVIDFLKEEHILLNEKGYIHTYELKKDLLPSLPEDFSTKAIQAIKDNARKPGFKPLLSKKADSILIGTFIMGYVFLLLDELVLNILYVSNGTLFHMKWFEKLMNLHPVFWTSIIVLASLLLIDVISKNNDSHVAYPKTKN